MAKNMKERIEFIRAMETIARAVSDEDIFEAWLLNGVPDGTIEVNGDKEKEDEELTYFYEDDDDFAALMATFCRLMRYMVEDPEIDEEDRKSGNGMLYADGIVSKRK